MGVQQKKPEEIIYEWGKSLIDFHTNESIKEQVGSVQVIGWNPMRGDGFRAKKNIEDISHKVGGRTAWTSASKSGGKLWVHNIFDYEVDDMREAGDIALAKLRQMSFKFLRAEGSAEGNQKLSAGMEVTVKYVGKAYSGDYIAEAVIHDFSMERGYITEFKLKRNMMDDEFVKQMNRKTSFGGDGPISRSSQAAQSQTEDENANDEDDEEEEGPEFRGLKWKKDGKEIEEALVDDDVTMWFEVKNIDEGERVNATIWEHDSDGEHDEIKTLTGEVKDGKVEIPWKVEYHSDEDDDASSCAREIEEYGYTVPEYFFVAEYGGVKSEENEHKLLNVKGWVKRQIKEKETEEVIANRKYTLILPDGTVIDGATDEDGNIIKEHESIKNDYLFYFQKEEPEWHGEK